MKNPNLSQKRYAFAQKAAAIAATQTGIMPSFFSATEMQNDLTLYDQMAGLEELVSSLHNSIRNTRLFQFCEREL